MAEYNIFNSQWTAQQIEASIGKNPRIGESGNWEVWNMSSMQFVDTGVLAEGKSVSHVDRTSGTGLPGTTDTYTIYDNDETVIGTFDVHNGSDGQGSPGSQTPKMDGTAAVGTANAYSREDHVHPHDDSKQPTINVSGILKGNGAGGVSAAVAGTDFAAMTNLHGRNLLDNPWFTVNQRNANAPYASGYFVDRWIGTGVAVSQSGTLVFDAVSSYIIQRLEDKLKESLTDKRLTASILFADGTIEVGDQVYTGNDGEQTYFFSGTYFQVVKQPNGDILFWCANPTKQVKAVKLELGSVSTLANDTAPNYAEELAKCQRFFEVFQAISVNFGVKQGSTIFSSPLQFAEKRVAPSISFIKVGGHDAVVEQIKLLDYGTDFTAANHNKKSIVFSTTDTSIENMAMSFSIMLSADL